MKHGYQIGEVSKITGISKDTLHFNAQGVTYTNIIFAGSLGIFVESICTKVLQARGNMALPMAALSAAREVEREHLYSDLSEWNRLYRNAIPLYAVYRRTEYDIGAFFGRRDNGARNLL